MIANEFDLNRKKVLKDMADKAILQAQWCKQVLEDQKQALRAKFKRQNSKTTRKVGLAFLGNNY